MKSMLEQLYLVQKGTYELIPDTEEYYKLNSQMCDKMDNFIKKLSKQNAEEFNEIADMQAGVQAEVSFAHFKEGFRIGLRLGLEMFGEEEI